MPAGTYTFQVELQQNYRTQARQKVVLGRTDYEPDEHVLLKFLGWCIFYHPRIAIEKKMDDDFEPDLILQDYDLTVSRWIECGKVSVNKLDKLTRRYPGARIYVLLPSERDFRSMTQQIDKKVTRPEAIRLVAFRDDVVGALLPVMTGKNDVWCNVSWPEHVEDPAASGLMEFEMTLNGTWVHTRLIVQSVGE